MVSNTLNRLVNGNTIELRAITEAEGHCLRFLVFPARNQGKGNLLLCSIANLLTKAIIRVINFDANPTFTQTLRNRINVVVEGLGNGDQAHLHRGEPCGESTGIMLSQNTDEALNRTKLRRVNHDRLAVASIGSGVFQAETVGLVEVVLNR